MAMMLFSAAVCAQKPGSGAPLQEKLLNGLKVLVWNDPSAGKVTVKVRVHSGSAFDPLDKEGMMKLVSESIFPNAATRDFFTDDLGGSLDVSSNYDYIQITATAKTDGFLSMLETLAAAVTNQTIEKDAAEALKAGHLAKLAGLENDASYIADQAVAKRLFGAFPYGRRHLGTIDSVKKIDFVDLRYAKDRFFTADNATIAISGNMNTGLALRAVRRYFGSWLKSDKKIPSTFKQPDEPDTATVEIAMPNITVSQFRYALRSLNRSDKDYPASEILSQILDSRFKTIMNSRDSTVTNSAHILPGAIVFRDAASAGPKNKPLAGIFAAITNDEFQKARSVVLAANSKRAIDELWLDVDTYKFLLADEEQGYQKATLADIQKVADRLSKNTIASATVSPATSAVQKPDR